MIETACKKTELAIVKDSLGEEFCMAISFIQEYFCGPGKVFFILSVGDSRRAMREGTRQFESDSSYLC